MEQSFDFYILAGILCGIISVYFFIAALVSRAMTKYDREDLKRRDLEHLEKVWSESPPDPSNPLPPDYSQKTGKPPPVESKRMP